MYEDYNKDYQDDDQDFDLLFVGACTAEDYDNNNDSWHRCYAEDNKEEEIVFTEECGQAIEWMDDNTDYIACQETDEIACECCQANCKNIVFYQDAEEVYNEALVASKFAQMDSNDLKKVNKAIKWEDEVCKITKPSFFLLDSGATCHVTNEISNLANIHPVSTRIMVAQNLTCRSTERGTLNLAMAGIPHVDNIILKGVYHVSEFNKKIICIH